MTETPLEVAMGIYVDYTLRAEGTEETVRERMETVRRRCMDLPLAAVGEVLRVEPVYNSIVFMFMEAGGHALPEPVARRLKEAEKDPYHSQRCLFFATMMGVELPKREKDRFYAPARDFMERTELWNEEDLPEEIPDDGPLGFRTMTFYRPGIALEMTNVMLRRGYYLSLDPGEGSETIVLALSTYGECPSGRSRKPPLWYGQSFTKTQYAKNFIQAHETTCRVLDILREEGLLLKGRDNCGYYATRSWKKASKRVNEELAFASLVGGMMGVAIGNLREEGVPVQVVQDNASKAKLVDFSSALEREQEVE